jgi:hypothetical protein
MHQKLVMMLRFNFLRMQSFGTKINNEVSVQVETVSGQDGRQDGINPFIKNLIRPLAR